jgi:hypothetical protein
VSDRVPDVVGEIVAVRMWYVGRVRTELRLLSRNLTVWEPDGWMVAECDECPDVPGEQCTCGIYAARDYAHLERQKFTSDSRYRVIVGEVGLAGKVIPATQGFRAEKARPLRFFAGYEEAIDIQRVAAVYGCAVRLGELGDDVVPIGKREVL